MANEYKGENLTLGLLGERLISDTPSAKWATIELHILSHDWAPPKSYAHFTHDFRKIMSDKLLSVTYFLQ
jgi:hypothetical protein